MDQTVQEVVFDALVVGAGPAGIAAVCSLLDSNKNFKVLWVDPQFDGGKIQFYKNVPANTKVGQILPFITEQQTLRNYILDGERCPLKQFMKEDLEKTCKLQKSYTMMIKSTQLLKDSHPRLLKTCVGTVLSVERDTKPQSQWVTQIKAMSNDNQSSKIQTYLATSLVFCHGSVARSLNRKQDPNKFDSFKEIDLVSAMDYKQCRTLFQKSDTVGLVGNSHSAMVVLKNLTELPKPPQKINIYYKHPRIYMQEFEDWTRNYITGLKGEIGDWCKSQLDQKAFKYINEVDVSKLSDEALLERLIKENNNQVVHAIGFQKDSLPTIKIGSNVLQQDFIDYDHESGELYYKGMPITNSYGYGIAFPNFQVDRDGQQQPGVGFTLFVTHTQNTLPEHIQYDRGETHPKL